ncbi:MAG: peptidoglycan bridge formation glycyltransferase FemA/FemB family protein [Bacteroidetes bacterium]|nr:peptidoglycan bridge formation glycyltransferase FemA/FemB family protein [Bacteroidota bacterium]MCW5895370.1 peptidoglycan bridge formation glycyltransferase FemA/FemB family protein [Bacteroidota bacterium]
MSGNISILDPCTSDEWLTFINTHPDAGIFHHPAWMNMLRDNYGYRVFAVCLKDGQTLAAGIPFADVRSVITGRRWVSLPFSDHCQPLLPRGNPEAIDTLLGYLKRQQGKEIPKIEIRWGAGHTDSVFQQDGFVVHSLELADRDDDMLFKSFNQQAQRSIRKAEKAGVTVKECTTFGEFELFYRLLVLTRKRLGVPAQPKAFFKGVWDHIIGGGLGFALIAFDETTPIGGGVFFMFNRTMFYKYGASDLSHKALQPNYAFMWNAIKRARAEGCTKFDFGRSDKNNEGLRRFKSGWSSEETNLAYTILADKPPRNGPSRIDAIAGAVIRNSPAFVCRVTGELLYKHFA